MSVWALAPKRARRGGGEGEAIGEGEEEVDELQKSIGEEIIIRDMG